MSALLESILVHPEGVRIPASVKNLASFRSWTRSERFPDSGRIDWIAGTLEIDMCPERFNAHATLKTAVTRDLSALVEGDDLGVVVTDSTRFVNERAGLSAEPDVVVLLFETLDSGKARLVPSERDPPDYAEVEGAADIVVEVVSPSSVQKDTERLVDAYFRAGVREYWLVDARARKLAFTLFELASRAFRIVKPDARGFRRSAVLGRDVKIVALPPRSGVVRYRVEFRNRGR